MPGVMETHPKCPNLMAHAEGHTFVLNEGGVTHSAFCGGRADDAIPEGFEYVNVTSLFVECSLRLRNLDKPGWTASDNCRQHATSAVQMEDNALHWRCTRHRGVRRQLGANRLGTVHEFVLRKAE